MSEKPTYEELVQRIKNLEGEFSKFKQAEIALRKAQQQLKLILDKVPALIWLKDCSGTYIQVNKAFCHTHGRSEKEIIGKTDFDIFTPELADQYVAADRRVLTSGTPEFGIEEHLQKPSGELGWSRKDKLVYFDADGNVAGTIGFAVDITEIKRTEEQVRHLQKAESLGRMAGAIAHHFNNLFAVVQGNLELALDNLPDHQETRSFLSEAMQATRRSSEISRMMLTYLGQSTGKMALLDLSDVCRQHLPLLRAALAEGVVLETDLLDFGPVVSSSGHQMRQVLTHLITNAAEATGDRSGRVTLATRAVSASDISKIFLAPVNWQPDAEVYACLEVSDSGCGMTKEDMDRLFDPFFTTKFTGRGLGLPVVLGIAKACNGAIGVESEKDRGSTFRVFFPVAADAVPLQSESAAAAHQMDKGGTVLLVEDQDPVRNMAAAMLSRLGYSVVTAANGADALEVFRQHHEVICCAITDLTMPGMDGWQTLAALRKLQPNLPAILASGYDEAEAMARDNAEKPNAFLHKPYSKDDLKNALSRALSGGVLKVA